MSGWIDWLAPIAVGAVAVVLIFGLMNMLRGGSAALSQTLMRWRVILQFVAIVIVMLVIYLKSS
ncbi:MAG: twin transmembrane helix small protein [Hyphomicrobiales bacterium]|nr:twin transmembrane helix small protein [Hyphomicrobiales bacterium]NBR12321.1 twin transmembrane helix small protein [Alphaproteobacteria bacterium]